jgi:hypothetical protein
LGSHFRRRAPDAARGARDHDDLLRELLQVHARSPWSPPAMQMAFLRSTS